MSDEQARPMGRPTKCTPELTAKFARLLEEGQYPDVACGVLNVSMDSYRRWLKAGEEDLERGVESAFAGFAAAVERGIARFKVALTATYGALA
jgi:hypothetical protein